MEFSRKSGVKRRSLQRRLAGDTSLVNLSRDFPLPIQMYSVAPDDDISLDEFQKIAVLRRNLLKEIEYVNTKYQKWSKDWNTRLREISRNHKLDVDHSDEVYCQEVRRRDHLSHFILRLAYSQSENLRRWMVGLEVDLFRFRFEHTTMKNKTTFMSENPEFKNYTPISESDYEDVHVEIQNSYNKFLREQINRDQIKFYKMPFALVPRLVASRSVYMKEGCAYVPSWDLQTIVANKFRAKLAKALAVTSKKLDNVRSDERIAEFIRTLDNYYAGPQYRGGSGSSETFQIEDIEDICRESFPLCMVSLHQTLRKDHHLKHGGRMQYGLFLKGIGVTLDESMKFWRDEFTKTMDVDKFDKQYTYNIRHHYGQEGRRTSYSAYSCSKIITSNAPGPQDNHGCPYRHFDNGNLRKILTHQGIQDKAIKEIIDLSSAKQYNYACAKYYEAKHSVDIQNSFVIDHPNKYFFESRSIRHPDKHRSTSADKGADKGAERIVESADKGAEKTASKLDTLSLDTVHEEFGDLNAVEFEDMDL